MLRWCVFFKIRNIYSLTSCSSSLFLKFYGVHQLVLPDGFERKEDKLYEEIDIPPSEPAPTNIGKERVPIDSLDEVSYFFLCFV
jgi:hypothetical protein